MENLFRIWTNGALSFNSNLIFCSSMKRFSNSNDFISISIVQLRCSIIFFFIFFWWNQLISRHRFFRFFSFLIYHIHRITSYGWLLLLLLGYTHNCIINFVVVIINIITTTFIVGAIYNNVIRLMWQIWLIWMNVVSWWLQLTIGFWVLVLCCLCTRWQQLFGSLGGNSLDASFHANIVNGSHKLCEKK
jgi:hypothetical protein